MHLIFYSFNLALFDWNSNHYGIFVFEGNCHFTFGLTCPFITFNLGFDPFIFGSFVVFSCSFSVFAGSLAGSAGTYRFLQSFDSN